MAEGQPPRNRGNFAEDREKASRAGRIGGQRSPGNFARDPARAAEAGRRGGERSHGTGRLRSVEDRLTGNGVRMPGQRDALPPGTVAPPPLEPQGDENRDPPPNAPIIPP